MFFKVQLKNLTNIICISTKHRIKSELIGNTETRPAQEEPAAPSRARLCTQYSEQDMIQRSFDSFQNLAEL